MRTNYSVGRVHAGEQDIALLPNTYKPGPGPAARGVLYAHFSGGTALNPINSALNPGMFSLARQICDVLGLPILSCDLGPNGGGYTWGNATHVARIGEAVAALSVQWGAKAGKVIMVGESMGGIGIINYAQANPANVAGVVGLIPVLGLLDIYNNNRGPGAAALVSAAYGGAPPAASDPSTAANETAYAATAIPTQIWYSTGDLSCVPAVATAWAAAVNAITPGQVRLNQIAGNLPHGDTAIAAIPVASVLGFLGAYL